MATALLPGLTGSRAESSRAMGSSSRPTGARSRRQWQTVSSWVSGRLTDCIGSCCRAVWRRGGGPAGLRRAPPLARRRCRSFSAAATHRHRVPVSACSLLAFSRSSRCPNSQGLVLPFATETGGGPAGLSAALILGRAHRRVIVFDSGEKRNEVRPASLFTQQSPVSARWLCQWWRRHAHWGGAP